MSPPAPHTQYPLVPSELFINILRVFHGTYLDMVCGLGQLCDGTVRLTNEYILIF